VDTQHKLIRRYTAVTDAAMHDSQVLTDMLQPQSAGRDVWADAAYQSEEIEAQLKKRKLRSRIQYKGIGTSQRVSEQALDHSTNQFQPTPPTYSRPCRTGLRSSDHGDGGQPCAHHWAGSGTREDRAEKSYLQLPAVPGTDDRHQRAIGVSMEPKRP
jgi:Transposase DDE domain